MSGVVQVEEVASFPTKEGVLCMTALPGGGIATGHGFPNVIRVWGVGGDLVATLEGHTHSVLALECSASGGIVSGSYDGSVKVWRDNTCVHTFQHTVGHSDLPGVFSVAVSPLDDTVVSGGDEGDAKVWSTATEECVATLEGHTETIRAVCVLSNGDVVTGSDDETVRLWVRGSWTCMAVLEEAGSVLALAAVRTGGFAACGFAAGDGFVTMWQDVEREWGVATAAPVGDLAIVQGAVAARTNAGVHFIQEGAAIGEWGVESERLASLGGGRLAVVGGGAGSHVCKVVQIIRLSRVATLHIMVTAWSAHGGTPPALAGSEPTAAVLARTLCLHRVCRPCGEGAPGASVEVVEPFGRDIVGFM